MRTTGCEAAGRWSPPLRALIRADHSDGHASREREIASSVNRVSSSHSSPYVALAAEERTNTTQSKSVSARRSWRAIARMRRAWRLRRTADPNLRDTATPTSPLPGNVWSLQIRPAVRAPLMKICSNRCFLGPCGVKGELRWLRSLHAWPAVARPQKPRPAPAELAPSTCGGEARCAHLSFSSSRESHGSCACGGCWVDTCASFSLVLAVG